MRDRMCRFPCERFPQTMRAFTSGSGISAEKLIEREEGVELELYFGNAFTSSMDQPWSQAFYKYTIYGLFCLNRGRVQCHTICQWRPSVILR